MRSLCFALLCLALSSLVNAATPDAPTMTVSTHDTTLEVTWNEVNGAEGYTLFYSPYPEADPVGSIDMGGALSISGELPIGSAFYLAVQAYNRDGAGDISNIENFAIDEVILPPYIIGTEENPEFFPSQVIFIESTTPYEEGEVIPASDDADRSLEIYGQADGSGLLTLPADLEAGEYFVYVTRGSATNTLTFTIAEIVFPVDSNRYVSDYLDDTISSISNLFWELGGTDSRLTTLLNSLEEFRTEFDTLDDEAIDELAKLLYANTQLLNEESTSNALAQRLTVYPLRRLDPNECTENERLLVLRVQKTVALLGLTVVSTLVPVVGTTAAGIFLAAGIIELRGVISLVNDLIEVCPGPIDDLGLDFFESSSLQSYYLTSAAELGRESSIHSLTGPDSTIRNVFPIEDSAWIFQDGVAENIQFTAYYDRHPTVVAIIDKIKSVSNSIAFFVPDSILTQINNLDYPEEKDVTDEVTLEQINAENVICTGTPASYICSFPDDGETHTETISFGFEVSHPDREIPYTQAAELVPGEAPVIQDQRFHAVPGNLATIEIEVVGGIASDEPKKVLEFQILEHINPSFGILTNKFNVLGGVTFSINIVEDMPETAVFYVRARNRYGWSEYAEITLFFNSDCPEVFGTTELIIEADGSCRINIFYDSGGLWETHVVDKDYNPIGLYVRYWENGAIYQETPYEDGKRNGVAKSYMENEKILSEIPYVDDLINGVAINYNSNGNGFIQYETPYVNNIKNGVSREYRDSGELYIEAPYVNNIIHGTYIRYYRSGVRSVEYDYVNGVTKELRQYYESGPLKEVTPLINETAHGVSIGYFESGALRSETTFVNNTKHGAYKTYHESGGLEREVIYVDGKRSGVEILYAESGIVRQELTYVSDIRHGTYKLYYDDGAIRYDHNYVDGKLDGTQRYYYENGILRRSAVFENGNQISSTYYNEDGTVRG